MFSSEWVENGKLCLSRSSAETVTDDVTVTGTKSQTTTAVLTQLVESISFT